MTSRPGATIVDRILRDDRDLGEPFLKRIHPPFLEASAHMALIRKEKDFVQKAQHSFGHRLFTRGATDRFKEAKLRLPEWSKKHLPEFQRWNVDALPGAARLQMLDQERVGALLCVAQHGFTGVPFITVYGGPVVTPVQASKAPTKDEHYGAPDWGASFAPPIIDQYLPEGVDFSHAVAASAASFTRGDKTPASIPEVEALIWLLFYGPGTNSRSGQ